MNVYHIFYFYRLVDLLTLQKPKLNCQLVEPAPSLTNPTVG